MTAPFLLMGLIINYFVMLLMKLESIMYPRETGSWLAPNPSQKKTINEVLCYVWHTLAGPICNYLNNPLFKYWFSQMHDFYATARHFLDDDTEQVTGDQMALILWVQSIVIRHYVLERMVFFWNENNYVDLYWYLDDFIVLYLTEGLNRTMGDDIWHRPESHTYSECDRGNMVFIVRNTLIGVLGIKTKSTTKNSLSLPSMRTNFPMNIISIDTGKELLMNGTALKFSSNKGGVNQNHLHHLHHTSANIVLLATMITQATCLALTKE
jgi:hypothetical protein